MTTVVKAADAAQFLSVLPSMLGFTPRRSIVLVPFAASRSLGAMRFDLPDADPDAAAATMVGLVCRVAAVDAVAAVVYTDAPLDGETLPAGALVDAVITRADACGLRLTDALCVGVEEWVSYLRPRDARGTTVDLVPPPGVPPQTVTGDQSSGTRLPRVDRAARAHVAEAMTQLDAAVARLCRPDGREVPAGADEETRISPIALAAVLELDDLPMLYERALDWRHDTIDSYDAALLAWCLSRPAARDVALVQWCAGPAAGDEALDAQLRWEAGEDYPERLAMVLWGDGDRPDPERLAQALAVVREVTALIPVSARAGLYAAAGWLSWALGRSTHADSYARRAARVDPQHGLAEIVSSFVAAGHLPDWAFRDRG